MVICFTIRSIHFHSLVNCTLIFSVKKNVKVCTALDKVTEKETLILIHCRMWNPPCSGGSTIIVKHCSNQQNLISNSNRDPKFPKSCQICQAELWRNVCKWCTRHLEYPKYSLCASSISLQQQTYKEYSVYHHFPNCQTFWCEYKRLIWLIQSGCLMPAALQWGAGC